MKNHKLLSLVIVLGLISCGKKKSSNSGENSSDPNNYRSFFQYCVEINSSPRIRDTIEALKDFFNEENCKDLEDELREDDSISLKGIGIKDLSPFARFTNIERLNLKENKITDLRPLATLRSLRELDVSDNFIKDLNGLNELEQLEELELERNDISNLDPLRNLKRLEFLELSYNHIQNISALKGIYSLEDLELDNNPLGREVSKNSGNCPVDNNTAEEVADFCRN